MYNMYKSVRRTFWYGKSASSITTIIEKYGYFAVHTGDVSGNDRIRRDEFSEVNETRVSRTPNSQCFTRRVRRIFTLAREIVGTVFERFGLWARDVFGTFFAFAPAPIRFPYYKWPSRAFFRQFSIAHASSIR